MGGHVSSKRKQAQNMHTPCFGQTESKPRMNQVLIGLQISLNTKMHKFMTLTDPDYQEQFTELIHTKNTAKHQDLGSFRAKKLTHYFGIHYPGMTLSEFWRVFSGAIPYRNIAPFNALQYCIFSKAKPLFSKSAQYEHHNASFG